MDPDPKINPDCCCGINTPQWGGEVKQNERKNSLFYLEVQSSQLYRFESTLSRKYQPVCGNETSSECWLSLQILQQMWWKDPVEPVCAFLFSDLRLSYSGRFGSRYRTQLQSYIIQMTWQTVGTVVWLRCTEAPESLWLSGLRSAAGL